MGNTIKQSDLIERISGTTIDIFNKFGEMYNTTKSCDYRDLLPAFTESLGLKLVVAPNTAKCIGKTDGKTLFIFEKWGMNTFYFAYFHELGHAVLHFVDGVPTDLPEEIKELEADIFAMYFCQALFPDNEESLLKIAQYNPIRAKKKLEVILDLGN